MLILFLDLRPNCAELVDELQSLGADYVVTEEEVMSSGLHQVFEVGDSALLQHFGFSDFYRIV